MPGRNKESQKKRDWNNVSLKNKDIARIEVIKKAGDYKSRPEVVLAGIGELEIKHGISQENVRKSKAEGAA